MPSIWKSSLKERTQKAIDWASFRSASLLLRMVRSASIHDEFEHVAARAAGEALVDAELRIYVHRRGVIVVEGTFSDIAPRPRFFEGHELLDNVYDIRVRFELLKDVVGIKCNVAKIVFPGWAERRPAARRPTEAGKNRGNGAAPPGAG